MHSKVSLYLNSTGFDRFQHKFSHNMVTNVSPQTRLPLDSKRVFQVGVLGFFFALGNPIPWAPWPISRKGFWLGQFLAKSDPPLALGLGNWDFELGKFAPTRSSTDGSGFDMRDRGTIYKGGLI